MNIMIKEDVKIIAFGFPATILTGDFLGIVVT